MTDLSAKQLVRVIVRSLEETGLRFSGSAKKKLKTKAAKRVKRKLRSAGASHARKSARKSR